MFNLCHDKMKRLSTVYPGELMYQRREGEKAGYLCLFYEESFHKMVQILNRFIIAAAISNLTFNCCLTHCQDVLFYFSGYS